MQSRFRNPHKLMTVALMIGLILLSQITMQTIFAARNQQQETVEKKKLPPTNWVRTRKIDVKHIAIDLRFDGQKKQAYGTTIITLAPFQATDKIRLDAGKLTIASVALTNGKPLPFTYDGGDKNDGLAITLDRIYRAGEDLTVKIDYRTNWINQPDPNSLGGSNGKGLRFSAPTTNDPTKPHEIWSMGEPESNRYWFPGYDAPNDFRTTEFTATVDKKFSVISNGKLINTKNNPDGTRTFHWKMDTPYANHQTAFVIGEYVDMRQSYNGIQLHNFSYPNETAATKASVERLPDMVKFFSEKIGVKYPFSSFSQVFVQDSGWGVGNMTLATQSENMVDDDRTHTDFLYLWDGLEGETLAQQWFGNYLTARDWSHQWLNKGFARYFSGLYSEYKNGRDEFLLYHHNLFDLGTYFNDWNAGHRQPIVNPNYANAEAFAADNYPYFRASCVLHMLRKHLGEENWWKAIRHYVQSNANKPVTTEDFRKAIEESTGEAMDWFFDQWLYKIGHPTFTVTKNYNSTNQQLTLKIQQTQKPDPNSAYTQVAFFAGKVEIEMDGRIEQVWLEPKAENVFEFTISPSPKLVHFDYESTWIKELIFEKSVNELLYQLEHDNDILGKNWALGQLVKIAQNEQTKPEVKTRILAAIRATIVSQDYWRFRLGALSQLQGLLAPVVSQKPVALDETTIAMLLSVIQDDKAWVRAAAINFLGLTREAKYDELYLKAFNDESDRVIYTSAIALGKSKSPKAFAALVKLKDKPSWKNQSLIAALNGLKELGDPRGFEIAFQALSDLKLLRWRLPTQLWDLRITAAETIVALGKSAIAYPLLAERFNQAIKENDLNDIFNNILLITTLADPRGQREFDLLKIKFKDDANAMQAVNQYESQFKDAIKQP